MAWSFETSFLAFLAVTFLSQAIAHRLKSMLPMPLLLGLFCAAGFYSGAFQSDMMLTANMIVVGTIAYNVLVVHSGTTIDIAAIRRSPKDALCALLPALTLVPVSLMVLWPLFGRDIALLAPGAAVGGGAACAIASRWVLDRNPAISVFPWMLFMFQGVFCIPIIRYAMKKEAVQLLHTVRDGHDKIGVNIPEKDNASLSLLHKGHIVERIPTAYKTTAYYLGLVMAVSVLNRYLMGLLPSGIAINLNVTALLLGFLFRYFGLLDKGPLFSSDSYGLLILGLMGLFANTIANNTLANLLRLLPAVLVTLALSSVVLVCSGLFAARLWNMSKWRCIILAMNSMMGFPVNKSLVDEASRFANTLEEKRFLAARLGSALGMGTMLVSNALSIVVASILTNLI